MTGALLTGQTTGTVRARLRAATAPRHEALHRHPLLRRLLLADLGPGDLCAANIATLRAFSALEALRAGQGIWPDFSLAESCARLHRDIGSAPVPAAHLRLPATAPHVLGALYAAHGAAFGAAQIGRALARHLPAAPQSYYARRDPQPWRALCERLERCTPADEGPLQEGAGAMFDLVHRCADAAAADRGLRGASGKGQ